MGSKLDHHGFLTATGASVATTSVPDLFAVRSQSSVRGTQTVKPELDVGD